MYMFDDSTMLMRILGDIARLVVLFTICKASRLTRTLSAAPSSAYHAAPFIAQQAESQLIK